MTLSIDFEYGDHGALLREENDQTVIVVAYLPEGARIGIKEAQLISHEYDRVRTRKHSTPLSAEITKNILEGKIQ